MYTYDQLKNGETTLQQVEEEQKDFKKHLNEIVKVINIKVINSYIQ